MSDNIVDQNKWVLFISDFSKKELAMNGWIGDDPQVILHIYKNFASLVKNGNYLELGCGTGILARFINLLSENKIIPHGIDFNINSIEIAKKNNPKYANNFIHQDYYSFLESNTNNLNKFSSISIFVNSNRKDWKKLNRTLPSIVKKYKSTNFIIICYEYDFLKIKTKEVNEFIIEMQKISTLSIASSSVIVIGKNKKIHTTASKLRTSI